MRRFWCVAFVTAVVCFALARGTALAAIEYCPARVAAHPYIAPGNRVALQLEANGPRIASGSLLIFAGGAWYQADFSNVVLAPVRVHVANKSVSYDKAIFLSGPIHVQIPGDLTPEYAYVAQAAAKNDPSFGWDARGMVACDPQVDAVIHRDENPAAVSPPGLALTMLAAQASQAGASVTCQNPFKAPAIAQLADAHIDESTYGVVGKFGVVYVVALDERGGIDDAWIDAGSGYAALDKAVLSWARDNTYTPGTSFCKPVHGYYIGTFMFDDRPKN